MGLEADEAAVAQMMGFSSFGMQDRPLKKRRQDGEADGSMTDGQPEPQGVGSQTSNPAPSHQPANTNEIPLDGDDDAASGTPMPTNGLSCGVTSSQPAGLPDRPPPVAGFTGSPADQQPQQGTQRQRGRHLKDDSRTSWYENYYDPHSNQNPWKRLERARGLQPEGSWILRDLRGSAAPSDAT